MAVELSNDRKAVEITWDASALSGKKVTIKCVNPDGGDVSTRKTENDGKAVITFPAGYSGETHVTVTDMGGREETGTIEV